jgi:hypothetical protein
VHSAAFSHSAQQASAHSAGLPHSAAQASVHSTLSAQHSSQHSAFFCWLQQDTNATAANITNNVKNFFIVVLFFKVKMFFPYKYTQNIYIYIQSPPFL